MPAITGPAVPRTFDGGAVVALDASAWYDAWYMSQTDYDPPPTFLETLLSADPAWYDTKDFS